MRAVVLTAFIGLLSAPVAHAQHHHGMRHFDHHHHHYSAPRGDWNWVAPAIIGGALLYGLTRPDPVIVQQPMYVPQPGFVYSLELHTLMDQHIPDRSS
jgi:hypothetical protein